MIQTIRKINLPLEIFSILVLELCFTKQLSAKIRVTFERRQGLQIGGTSFYEASDQFENIIGKNSSNTHHKTKYCNDLDAICYDRDCQICSCRDNVPFLSYNIGCRNDYFNGKCLWIQTQWDVIWTLIQRLFLTLWTSDGRQNNVVCLLNHVNTIRRYERQMDV